LLLYELCHDVDTLTFSRHTLATMFASYDAAAMSFSARHMHLWWDPTLWAMTCSSSSGAWQSVPQQWSPPTAWSPRPACCGWVRRPSLWRRRCSCSLHCMYAGGHLHHPKPHFFIHQVLLSPCFSVLLLLDVVFIGFSFGGKSTQVLFHCQKLAE